ncbi:MAG: glycosyltransferase family protein [Anaerolineae bacterium]|nr:glycosyltransferase family protein [Anaerolineae bacterium]
MKNVVVIIQARMAASRLPGKVLEQLEGRPVLAWVVARALRAEQVSEVVVATTDQPEDDVVAEFCEAEQIHHFRGSMHDVLDRYYHAAKQYKAEVVVRLTADCPFIDPAEIDRLLAVFLAADPPLDFAANRLPMHRTIPIGLDAEVCTMDALETAWQEAVEPHQREHVMPFFYENTARFNTMHLTQRPDYGHLRWTVDTRQDLDLVRQIAAHFDGRDDFSWKEILALYEKHPELAVVNEDVRHKDYREVDDRR